MTNINQEFALDPDLAYLNHAAVAPWPARSGAAIGDFVQANVKRGAEHYPDWLKIEHSLRSRMARLINAPSDSDISLLKSTSEGLSLVAHGLPWKRGDNVVIYDCEFPSNRVVWESLQRYGVTTRQVPLRPGSDSEQELLDRCDERTRLISVSSVQFSNGYRTRLEPIGEFCRRNGILFCVDAIQSLGALQFDCQRCQADFVVADGHKWMLGPEGLALFYSRAEVRDQLELHEYGWHMLADPGNYARRDWQPATDGTRFECGSPNLLASCALNASLGLLLEQPVEQVEKKVLERRDALLERLQSLGGLELLGSDEAERKSGILTLKPLQGDAQALHAHLMKNRVICAPRGGGVRLSPHFYTPDHCLDLARDRIAEWQKTVR